MMMMSIQISQVQYRYATAYNIWSLNISFFFEKERMNSLGMSIYWVVSEFSKWAVGTQDIVQVYSVILPQTVSPSNSI